MTLNICYPINEIFATIQGEATFTGTASIFIRMQGCDVGCPWCDTKHTWDKNLNNKISLIELNNKTNDKNTWASANLDDITQYICAHFNHIKHVVITGGEPGLYDLSPLCNLLEINNKQVQIETSGTTELAITANTWVTLSPKINMPGNKPLLYSSVKRANEIKMPIGKMQDIENLYHFLDYYRIAKSIPIWLQPLSQNITATTICIEQALQNNWHLSLQTHKFINIR